MDNRTEKILIVDDISKNIQILGNILAQRNYNIAYAQSGTEALKICEMQHFDLILLDIMMPEMDGYEVCARLKDNPKTKEIPIIFLTAKADMESIVKGFDVGGQEYITKPFNSAELLARVQTHLLLRKQKLELKHINTYLEDIVKERTAQLEKANSKLEQLDQAKSNFLALISHEIRTPLNGIIGLTQLLEQTDIDDNQREYLNYLTEVSARLVKFSDIAMLITRLKTDNYDPNILSVSLQHLIETSIEKFKKENPYSNIQIQYKIPTKQTLVMADSELTVIGFIMLMENVEKYGGINATLNIHIDENDDSIMIQFVDNGPGFSPQALNHIFQLFSAGDIMHHEGSGLSLATLKLITDIQKGEIDVANQKEGGASVTLTLQKP
jgi:two-component system sensor histidine kinase/response regulator